MTEGTSPAALTSDGQGSVQGVGRGVIAPDGDTDFGVRLRQARERAGLSQERLAHFAGCSEWWVRQIEAGRREPRLSALHALYGVLSARVPGLNLTWLVTGRREDGANQPVHLASGQRPGLHALAAAYERLGASAPALQAAMAAAERMVTGSPEPPVQLRRLREAMETGWQALLDTQVLLAAVLYAAGLEERPGG